MTNRRLDAQLSKRSDPMTLWRLFGITLIFSLPAPVVTQADDRPSKPNVVLLLADDLGWQDVKCYHIDEPSPMETPKIDAFAKRGVMFWQAYSTARQPERVDLEEQHNLAAD